MYYWITQDQDRSSNRTLGITERLRWPKKNFGDGSRLSTCQMLFLSIIIIIIRTFVTCAVSANILNLRRSKRKSAADPSFLGSPTSCLSNALDRPNQFCPSVCICEQIGCRTITSTILYQFSPNFACSSQMWSLWCLLFERQTGSSLLILEVRGFRFRQFSGSGDHIFQQVSTKSHVKLKFSNADFVFNGEWNRK